jgi:hypothetical protein
MRLVLFSTVGVDDESCDISPDAKYEFRFDGGWCGIWGVAAGVASLLGISSSDSEPGLGELIGAGGRTGRAKMLAR